MTDVRRERTLILIKPDGIQRALSGTILARFEQAGLKIVGLKMVLAQRSILERHYPADEAWVRTIGGKTREAFQTYGLDVRATMGTDDPVEIGRRVRGWLIEFMQSTPVIAAVLEGVHAVSVTRKIVGNTLPVFADPGTIRGDFSADAPTVANAGGRPVRNLIHASGSVEEAGHEVGLWFAAGELHAYPRADEAVMFGGK
ncbi:MAG: nucleoside-diphosphate kinase [Armatimonadetes bacterium 13_1_40CM_3_65_7]|nr:MAG: nucleoside-diphosphate kinase [Armatimonadetes bacterium 13_1_40CM_3_65_7]